MTKSFRKAAETTRPMGPSLAPWVPVFYLIFVFLLGGGSRSDVASLPILRGISVIVAAWAAMGLRPADWQRVRVPLFLFIGIALWMAVQLVPVPPSFWHGLPARGAIASIDSLLGQADLWRPITLTPDETWNALLGMSVPFAALFLAARIEPDDYPRLMVTILVLGVVGALLGILQVLFGNGSPVYLYRITNSGMMVGLFANRNHHAVFLACAIVVAGFLLRDELMRKQKRGPVRVALAAAIVFLTIIVALTGSRAGLVAGVAAFAASYAMAVAAWPAARELTGVAGGADRGLARRALLVAPPLLVLGLMATTLALSDRATAVSRLADQALADDMRVMAWPTVQQMMGKFWLLGSGFGSFPSTYRIFEPDALLQPAYFNHAHNDWAEALITGGVPFALLVLAGILWIVRGVAARGMRNLVKGHRGDLRLPVSLILAILAMSSLVDYPLRVPSLQVFAILLFILLCAPWQLRGERE